jgi:hypothetical protein
MFLDCVILFVVFDDASITFVIESGISPKRQAMESEILAGSGLQIAACLAFFNSGV